MVDFIDDAALALEEGRIANARKALDQAYVLVSKANGDLYGTAELELSATLPLAGANLRALREGVALATRLVDGGRRILQAAAPLEGADGTLEVSLKDGTLSIDAVAATQRELRALVGQLPGGDPDLEAGVIGPLADATESLYSEANRRRDQLGVLDRGLSLLAELAGGNGDRTYLLAVANNAEMRGSGGMILNYGVLSGSGGTIDLSDFGRVDELVLYGAGRGTGAARGLPRAGRASIPSAAGDRPTCPATSPSSRRCSRRCTRRRPANPSMASCRSTQPGWRGCSRGSARSRSQSSARSARTTRCRSRSTRPTSGSRASRSAPTCSEM